MIRCIVHYMEMILPISTVQWTSQITPPYVDEKILDKIVSPFQKRALRGDMGKTVLKDAIEKDYDVLMMDMIEERHDLSVFGESFHTRCSEYMSGLYEPNPYGVIGKISDEKLSYWKQGFDFLATSLRRKGAINKMVISKAYFTDRTNAPPPKSISLPYVERMNAFLDLMYDHISKTFPEVKFIEYSDDELVSDVAHPWGFSAFHYVKKYGEKQIKYLLDMLRPNEAH